MSGRPNSYLNWTDGSPTKVIQPDAAFALEGWDEGQAPPAEYMNWLFYETDQWIKYFDTAVSPGIPDQALRLLKGGHYSFNLGTSAFAWSENAYLGFASVPDSNNTILPGSVTLLDGQVAYVTANTPYIVDATSQSGSNILISVSYTADLAFGMTAIGPGVPANTTITVVGANTVSLSNPVTSTTVNGTFIFSDSGDLTVNVVDNASFIPDFDTIMIARRSGDEVYVGVNTGQMVLRDLESKPLLGSGYFTTYTGVAGQALTAGQIVYISPGSSDGSRTAGALYPLDCGSTFSQSRATYAGIVITAAASGANVHVLWDGFYDFTGLVLGEQYYADPTTPGGITNVMPTGAGQKTVPVGVALTTTQLLVSSGGAPGGLFSQPVLGKDSFNTPGTTFTLSNVPLSSNALFLYVDGRYIATSDWSLSGQVVTLTYALAAGQSLDAQYVLADQVYLTGNQETATPVGSAPLQQFVIDFQPLGTNSLSVFVDGAYVLNSTYSLTFNSNGTTTIVFAAPLAVGQEVDVTYLAPVGASSVGSGGITGAVNEGTGVGVYIGVSGTNLKLKSIVAGSGITATDGGDHVTLAATGSGSSQGIYGSALTPHTFDPTLGLTIGAEADQIYYLSTGAGALTVSATTQISAGAFVGQRLTLRGADMTNYYIFQGVAGTYFNGVNANGDCPITANGCLKLYWDGSGWYEETRR